MEEYQINFMFKKNIAKMRKVAESEEKSCADDIPERLEKFEGWLDRWLPDMPRDSIDRLSAQHKHFREEFFELKRTINRRRERCLQQPEMFER